MEGYNPAWAASLHADLGEKWMEAITLLVVVLGSRFAWGFQERDAILRAAQWLAENVAEEAIAQTGGKERHRFDA
jgi:hypothetical protein